MSDCNFIHCLGELWCSEWQYCAPADPQANDDTDFNFKNPLPQKKVKLMLDKGKEKVTASVRAGSHLFKSDIVGFSSKSYACLF